MKTENFEYEIKRAAREDIPAIIKTALIFWYKSGHGETKDQSPRNFRKLLEDYIDSPGCRCLIAVRDGEVIGYFIFYTHDDYKDRLDGELYQFFIHPDYWGSNVGRDLVEMGVQTFDDWGCSASHVCLAGDVGPKELSLVRNLFAKFGYIETGIVMTRRVKTNGITESSRTDTGPA
jgi:GNAT superfamily N-acetyltransferase